VNPDFQRDFPLAMKWIAEGRVNVAPIITHRFALADIQQAFDLFCHRRDGTIKVIVEFPAKGTR
jgi:threonine dehydrogenase-like Zn-dependent dehydrogenase